jgi:hypothetical protein
MLGAGHLTTTRTCAGPPSPRPAHSPSREACLTGWRAWLEAQKTADGDCEVLERRDPQIASGTDETRLRRELLTQDRTGVLGWARMQATMAESTAKTSEERLQAGLLLAWIDCDQSNHAAELKQALWLVAIAPRRPEVLALLRRARGCNGNVADCPVAALTPVPSRRARAGAAQLNLVPHRSTRNTRR